MKNLSCSCAIFLALCGTAAAAAPAPDATWYASGYVMYAMPSDYDGVFGLGTTLGRQLDAMSSVAIDVGRASVSGDVLEDENLQLTPLLIKYRRTLPLAEDWSASVGLSAGVVLERWDYRPLLAPEERHSDSATAGAAGGEVALEYQPTDHLQFFVAATALVMTDTAILDGVLPQFRFGVTWTF